MFLGSPLEDVRKEIVAYLAQCDENLSNLEVSSCADSTKPLRERRCLTFRDVCIVFYATEEGSLLGQAASGPRGQLQGNGQVVAWSQNVQSKGPSAACVGLLGGALWWVAWSSFRSQVQAESCFAAKDSLMNAFMTSDCAKQNGNKERKRMKTN